jgi:hypothetical protein
MLLFFPLLPFSEVICVLLHSTCELSVLVRLKPRSATLLLDDAYLMITIGVCYVV